MSQRNYDPEQAATLEELAYEAMDIIPPREWAAFVDEVLQPMTDDGAPMREVIAVVHEAMDFYSRYGSRRTGPHQRSGASRTYASVKGDGSESDESSLVGYGRSGSGSGRREMGGRRGEGGMGGSRGMAGSRRCGEFDEHAPRGDRRGARDMYDNEDDEFDSLDELEYGGRGGGRDGGCDAGRTGGRHGHGRRARH